MKNFFLFIGLLFYSFITSLLSPAIAGDLSSEIRNATTASDNDNGGYFEIGLGVAYYSNPVIGMPENNEKGEYHDEYYVDINARYQYQGFFVETFSQSIESLTFGYNFYDNKKWSMDWIATVQHGEMSENTSDDYRDLNKRYTDFMMGPRSTHYLGKTILQFHLLKDISNTHHGELAALKLARHWQYRNWTLHGIVGATYRSDKVIDYYFGIDESEASEKFPVHTAKSGMAYIYEVGATYPLSEKWVFRSFVRRVDVDSEITQSPLILDDHGEIFATSISYVF
jgi:MipA family protein